MKKIQLLFCLLLIPIIVSAQDVWQAKYVEIEQSIKVPNFKNKQYRITKFEALASALAAVNQKAFDTDNGCMADLGCTQDNHDHDYPSAENVAIDCLLGNICSEGWNSIAFPSVTMVEYNSSKLGNPVEKVDNSKQHKWNCQFALEKDVELIGNYRNPVYVLNSWNPTQISMVDTLRIQGARGRLAATLEVPVLKVGEKCPIVIICHGFGGNRDRGTTYMVAKQLPNEGIATLRFDFNGHGQSDYFEGVTHSLCTLEFVPHRPLYDLFVDWVKEGKDLDDNRPHQYEFNKLNLNYTLMSKRNLLILVKEHLVNGWDDPRMPTICGFRRRGYSPESIRKFVDKIGYTTYDALNDFALLESAVREDLNSRATRVSAVINPVKLIITNYPEGQVEEMEAVNNPEDPSAGTHTIEFSRELWIERDDFMEDAPKKYFRMTPGQEVRLKSGYIVKCTGCKKDDNGNVVEVYCEYDPDSKTGMPGSNRKIKGTIHWVSCAHCLPAEVRLYDRLWKVENPRDEMAAIREAKNCDALEAMKEMINPDSLNVLTNCYVEKYLADAKPLDYLQFQRIGYFNVDKDSTPEHLVFNRTVSLKDTWSKINK